MEALHLGRGAVVRIFVFLAFCIRSYLWEFFRISVLVAIEFFQRLCFSLWCGYRGISIDILVLPRCPVKNICGGNINLNCGCWIVKLVCCVSS